MKTFRIKIKNILFLYSILLSGCVFAQGYMPLPDSNVLWEDWRESAQGCDYYKIYIPDSNSDTVINGLTYRKLFAKWVSTYGPPPDPAPIYFMDPIYFGALRQEDSGHVYFIYPYDQEEVLYMDLTVQQGDTVKQLPCRSTATSSRLADLRVDSVDFVSNGPYLRKRIFLRDLNPYIPDWPNYLVWIEGIGNVTSGLINWVDNGYSEFYTMNCMSVSDTIFYEDNYEYLLSYVQGVCILKFTTDLHEVEHEFPVTVYPVPAKDYVIFEQYTTEKNGFITITDITGRPVTSFPMTGEKTVWQTEEIKPGVYLYRLQTPEGSACGKLLITP